MPSTNGENRAPALPPTHTKFRYNRNNRILSIDFDSPTRQTHKPLLGTELVYQVTGVGKRLSERRYMMIDNGGTAEPVTDHVFNVGLGLLTLLDGAKDEHPALVNLTGGTDYYDPQIGALSPFALLMTRGKTHQSYSVKVPRYRFSHSRSFIVNSRWKARKHIVNSRL